MQKCCKNSYQLCEPFVGCPQGLIIGVPPTYTDTEIFLRFYKNQNLCEVVSGTVDEYFNVFLQSTEFSEGFFNPYGGTYSVAFFDSSNNALIEFEINGTLYDAIDFSLIQGTAPQEYLQEYLQINIFTYGG